MWCGGGGGSGCSVCVCVCVCVIGSRMMVCVQCDDRATVPTRVLLTARSPRALPPVFCTGRSDRAGRTRWPCPTCWSDTPGSTCTCPTAAWTRTPGSGGRSPGIHPGPVSRIWICWSACLSPRRCDSSVGSRWCRRWPSSCCRRTSCGYNTWSSNSQPFLRGSSPGPAGHIHTHRVQDKLWTHDDVVLRFKIQQQCVASRTIKCGWIDAMKDFLSLLKG